MACKTRVLHAGLRPQHLGSTPQSNWPMAGSTPQRNWPIPHPVTPQPYPCSPPPVVRPSLVTRFKLSSVHQQLPLQSLLQQLQRHSNAAACEARHCAYVGFAMNSTPPSAVHLVQEACKLQSPYILQQLHELDAPPVHSCRRHTPSLLLRALQHLSCSCQQQLPL